MSWTYRVVRQVLDDVVVYGIHEAYDDGDPAAPHSITERAVAPIGDTVDELAATLDRMKAACAQPPLEHGDF